MSSGVRIVNLCAENVKRITAIDITPQGDMVVIGGRNGSGKSSTLDAILYALIGGKSLPEKPVRDGAKSGTVTITLDNGLVVTRLINADRTAKLIVTTGDGMRAAQPQQVLDKLYGSLSFDPLSFAAMEPKKQAAVLRELVGLDFSDLDAKRAALFDDRTDVNRRVRDLDGRIRLVVEHLDAPTEEVSVADLAAEVNRLSEEHGKRGIRAANAAHFRDQANQARRRIEETKREIERLERLVVDLHTLAGNEDEKASAIEAELAATPAPDIEPVRLRMETAEATNRQVRANRERAALVASHLDLKAESDALTEQLAKIDADKQAQLAAAKFPVPGLSFDADGVLFNGLPFAQSSQAEKLRVSVAMGLALNPTLRVILCRDGSLLDDDNIQLLAEMAAEHDAQVWLERVGAGAEVSVVIEDGAVKETRGVALTLPFAEA